MIRDRGAVRSFYSMQRQSFSDTGVRIAKITRRLRVLFLVISVSIVVLVVSGVGLSAVEASDTCVAIDLRAASANAGGTVELCDQTLTRRLTGKQLKDLKTDGFGRVVERIAGEMFEASDKARQEMVKAAPEGDVRVMKARKRIENLTSHRQALEATLQETAPVREEFEPKDAFAKRLKAFELQQARNREIAREIASVNAKLAEANQELTLAHAEALAAGRELADVNLPRACVMFILKPSLSKYDMDNGVFVVTCQNMMDRKGTLGARRPMTAWERLNLGTGPGAWKEVASEGTPGISIRFEGSLHSASSKAFAASGFRDVEDAKAFKDAALADGLHFVIRAYECPQVIRGEEFGRDRTGGGGFYSVDSEGQPRQIKWTLSLDSKKGEGLADSLLTGSALTKRPRLIVKEQD